MDENLMNQTTEEYDVTEDVEIEEIDVPVEDVEDEITAEEIVHDIIVESEEEVVVDISESIGWVSGDNRYHDSLLGIDFPNQHPIKAIAGLREELDNIEALQTVYSDKKQQADYYMWRQDEEHPLPANPYGVFVSILKDTDKIQICNGESDVFGITVAEAAFVGNQEYAQAEGGIKTGRDGSYCLVVHSGLVGVRCETTVIVGNYVMPNIRGEAKKSEGDYGYLVTALSEVNGVQYAIISLSAPSTLAKTTADNVQNLSERMKTAEYNITSVTNVANSAYVLAKDAKENADISSEFIEKKITEVLGEIDAIDNAIGDLNEAISGVSKVAKSAEIIAQNAVSAAQQMGDDAYASANEAIAAIKDIGAGSTSWAKRLDGYSVGEYSQAYGLTWEQAKSALPQGVIYIPTIVCKESYAGADDSYEQEFSLGYFYTWNGEIWIPSLSTAVSFSNVHISGSSQTPYWVVTNADVEYNSVIYKLGYLYKWDNDAWIDTGASVAENTLTRAVSAMHQTANELSMEVSNVRGDVAALDVRVDENEATVQTLARWTGCEEGKYNIATAKFNADDEGASVALVAVKDGVDEELGGARIVLNDSEKGSYIQLDADHIDFEANDFKLQARYINLEGAITIDSFDNETSERLIESVVIEYALSDSSKKEDEPQDGWSITAPTWESGRYMWQRTTIKYIDSEKEPLITTTCIQGAKGEDGGPGSPGEPGSPGVSVIAIIAEYHLSNDKDTAPSKTNNDATIGWTSNFNTIWENSKNYKYIWYRERVKYSAGPDSFTDARVDNTSTVIASWCDDKDKTLINGAHIATGTIDAKKISTDTLSAISANLGTVNTGNIQSPGYMDAEVWEVSEAAAVMTLALDEPETSLELDMIEGGINTLALEDEISVAVTDEIASEGLAFTSNGDGTCTVSGIGSCADTKIVIPSASPSGDTVTSISNDAFNGCESLTNITISDGVSAIGTNAFANCTKLTHVRLPSGITQIRGYTFANCVALTKITIPGAVVGIGGHAFANCTSLQLISMHTSIKEIGINAFTNCPKITDVYYNGTKDEWNKITVKTGNDNFIYATINCYSSGLAYRSEGGYYIVTGIGSCTDKDVVIPSRYDNFPVTQIDTSAFSKNTNITSVTIPDSITKIRWGAFWKCSNLERVYFGKDSKLTYIGGYAFHSCVKLKGITIPTKVIDIKEMAFCGCTALEEIYFNAATVNDLAYHHTAQGTVEKDQNKVFYDAGINSSGIKVIIGSKVTKIPAYLFCPQGTTDFTASEDDKKVEGSPKIISIDFKDNRACTSIGQDAFYGCYTLNKVNITNIKSWCHMNFGSLYSPPSVYAKGLYLNGEPMTKLIIPEGTEYISWPAFFNCQNIVSIVVPDSVKSIHSTAFNSCTNLENIIIGNGIQSIASYAFNYDTKLKSVYYKGSATDWSNISIDTNFNDPLVNATKYFYSETEPTDGGNYWHYKDGFKISCNDDNMIDSKYFTVSQDGTVRAENGEFTGNIHATDGEFARGKIGAWTLDSQSLYSTNGVYSTGMCVVGDNDDYNVPSEQYLSFELIEEKDEYQVSDCSPDAVCIIIPLKYNGLPVTSIKMSAFLQHEKLLSVVIPHTVTIINQGAFSACYNLKSVIIPDSVQTISFRAFEYCQNLTIYCEAETQPSGWSSIWNFGDCPVVWGYKENNYEYDSLVNSKNKSTPCIFAGSVSDGIPYNGDPCNFLLLKDGSLYANAAKITGHVEATSGKFKGEIQADSGCIGGLNITNRDIFNEERTFVIDAQGAVITNTLNVTNILMSDKISTKELSDYSGKATISFGEKTDQTTYETVTVTYGEVVAVSGKYDAWNGITEEGSVSMTVTTDRVLTEPHYVRVGFRFKSVKTSTSTTIYRGVTIPAGTNTATITGGYFEYIYDPKATISHSSCGQYDNQYVLPYPAETWEQPELIESAAIFSSVSFVPATPAEGEGTTATGLNLGGPKQCWNYVYSLNESNGSDRKIKDNISDVDNDFSMRLVNGLVPKSYTFKAAKTPRMHYGFIAQEVEELLYSLGTSPDEVGIVCKSKPGEPDGEDNYYGLNYTNLIAPMVSVIQQLSKRVEELENNLATQQND